MSPEIGQVATLVKYVTATSVTIVLWDHILTLAEEITLIWKGPITKTKALFVVQRYGATLVFIVITYVIFGIRTGNDQLCQVLTTVIMAFGLWMQAYMNYVMVSRLYVLWDYRKGIITALVTLCALVSATTTAMTLINDIRIIRTVVPEPSYFHMCIYPVRPRLWAGTYGCQCVFDIFTLALTVFSAKTRPLRIQVGLIKDFLFEGLFMHLLLFVPRVLNVVLALTPNEPGLFVIALPLTYAASTVSVTRLVLRLEGIIAFTSRRRAAMRYELDSRQTY